MTDRSMDTLHTVLRAIRGETKSRRDHVSVFREFLDHLGKVSKRRTARPSVNASKTNGKSRRR